MDVIHSIHPIMKKTNPLLHEPAEAEIQKKAYHLWIEGGCLQGVELDNWLAAKELLRLHREGRSGKNRPKRPSAMSA
jgi:hypothetical protein